MLHASQSNRFTVLLGNPHESVGWHENISRLLEPQGVQTISTRTGREALEVIERRPVHVAVLDAQMPQLGGLQVVRMLRDQPNAPPAILVANNVTTQLLNEALMMHVFSVLSKPVDLNVLLDALARVLKRHYESRWPG